VPEDQINANIYPVTTFAYLLENEKKLLFFTDRPQGVACYEKDLLINFDRLALDDSKGVGENYLKTVKNTFRYKFAMISQQDDTERVWQKEYDEAMIGYLSKDQSTSIRYKQQREEEIVPPSNILKTNLKYSIYYLNAN
jgi:hypothetical protein